MTAFERAIRRFDRFQLGHPMLGFPFGVVKKFGDDDGGTLAGTIAYYGFFSMFPLLLLLVSVLGLVLRGDPSLERRVVHSALAQFPVIGPQLHTKASIAALGQSTLGIVVAGFGLLWAGLGVVQAAEKAMNTVWDVPRSEWPNFVFRRVRAVAILALLGLLLVVSAAASGLGSAGALPSGAQIALGWAISLGLNVVLFVGSYKVLTARRMGWKDILPGAVVAAVAWTVLEAFGGWYVGHEISHATQVYGAFALMVGLLIWISLGAQVMLLGAECNVVLRRKLWPRPLVQPPINRVDQRVYEAIAKRAKMRPEVDVQVSFHHGDSGPRPEEADQAES